jgi:hypothetical protein
MRRRALRPHQIPPTLAVKAVIPEKLTEELNCMKVIMGFKKENNKIMGPK